MKKSMALALTCLSLSAAGWLHGAILWTNTVGGTFSVAGNWSPNQVPGLTHDVTFNLGAAAAYGVAINAPVTNATLTVQKDKLLLNLSGGPYALSGALSVESSAGPSELTMTGGVFRMYGKDKSLLIGSSVGKTGIVEVSGANTVVDMQPVPSGGLGYLMVGSSGGGFLRVRDGALIKNMPYFGVGRNGASSYGSVLIDNAVVSNVTAGGTIGEAGGALIVVTNKGRLHINTTWAAHRGRIVTTGAGSRISSGNYLTVSMATLIVTNGGWLTPSACYLGYGGSSAKTGTVVVAGSGSLLKLTSLLMIGGHASFGTGGVGLLGVADSGTVNFVTGYAWSNAVVTLNGGRLYGNNSTFYFHPRSLLRGTGVVERANVANSGVFAPGLPTGSLVISNANYTQYRTGYPVGRLELAVGGRDEGQYSRLEVDGTMTLAGTCAVRLVDGFKPAIGDSFRLLKWKTLAAGRFAAVELPSLSGGKSWVTNDLYLTGTIAVDGAHGTTLFVR